MLIDGKDYKINILVLLMLEEVDVTVETLETLLEGIEDGVTISVLLNGGTLPELRKLFSSHEHVRYYESEKNLGVAGGRNHLLKTSECSEADIIFGLDNDVVTPLDYVRSLATFLVRHEDAGVVGSVIADIKLCIGYSMIKNYGDKGAFGNKILKVKNKDVKDYVLGDYSLGMIYHMGIHPDYYYAYFSTRASVYDIVGSFLEKVGIKLNNHYFIRDNHSNIDAMKEGKEEFEVSNVGGGSVVFRRKLLDEIGPYNEKFNPYGFEDSDFAIRALKAGHKNYIDTNTWLLHGTDTRHKERDYYWTLSMNIKGRTVLASTTYPGTKRYRRIMKRFVYLMFFFEALALNRDCYLRLKARLEGFEKGVRIVEEDNAAEV